MCSRCASSRMFVHSFVILADGFFFLSLFLSIHRVDLSLSCHQRCFCCFIPFDLLFIFILVHRLKSFWKRMQIFHLNAPICGYAWVCVCVYSIPRSKKSLPLCFRAYLFHNLISLTYLNVICSSNGVVLLVSLQSHSYCHSHECAKGNIVIRIVLSTIRVVKVRPRYGIFIILNFIEIHLYTKILNHE